MEKTNISCTGFASVSATKLKRNAMSIKLKILATFGALFIVIGAFLTLILVEAARQEAAIEEVHAKLTENTSSTIPLLKAIDALQMDVLQVQQWLTDISATRGLSGLDDGFSEAQKYADKFRADLQEARKHTSVLELNRIDNLLAEVGKKFEPYYATGVKMAQSYVKSGPEAGNSMMASFDKVAEDIHASLEKAVLSIEQNTKSHLDTLLAAAIKVEESNQAVVNHILAGMAFLAVFFLAMSAYLFMTLKRNFDNMREDLVTVMNKDLQTKLRGNPKGHDEFSEVSRALVVFRDKLVEVDRMAEQAEEQKKRTEAEKRAMMVKMADDFDASVGGIVQTVSSASAELQATAEAMTGISQQTSTQATEASQGSQQTLHNVQSVASATEELTSTIGEISQQVAQASSASQQAVEEVGNTSRQMSALAETANKIGEVIELISGIAEQTNLLALNATIESARAGEAGKGFAVVANEVKELASQTAKATSEISQQISDIQNATHQATGSMDSVAQAISRVDEISTAIAAAMEEQSAATQEIASSVNQAAVGTQHVNDNIASVNEASQEAGAASGQVMSAAGELSQQAEILKGEVEKFILQVRAG